MENINEILVSYLAIKLSEEMKNVIKNHLTKTGGDDIIYEKQQKER